MNLESGQIAQWHRRLCPVTSWLVISGDLSPQRSEALEQLAEWTELGISDVVDVREEWNDEKLVAQLAPSLRYHYLGTHDNGGPQDAEWFDAGYEAYRNVRERNESVALIHCHMGVNRGPSMAFAWLLFAGWDPVDALDAIRAARPIAGIIYADSAVSEVGRILNWEGDLIDAQRQRVESWFDTNDINIAKVIRKIRESERF
jgi:protein-tyrosine phosphatase